MSLLQGNNYVRQDPAAKPPPPKPATFTSSSNITRSSTGFSSHREMDTPTPLYQAVTSQRNNVVNRTSNTLPAHSSGSLYKSSSMDRIPRASLDVEIPDLRDIREGREKSKKDMQELNERLAGHIEKTRYMSAQNKKLKDELQGLKARWGKETEKIRQMYDVELKQLRKLIDDAEREKGEKNARISSLEETNKDFREELTETVAQNEKLTERLDQLHQEIADKERDLSFVKRRLLSLEEERKKERESFGKLKGDLVRNASDLENETAGRLAAQNESQTFREELEFLKRIHAQEIKELQVLIRTDNDQSREFWRNELGQAIHEIQTEYDNKFDSVRTEMETMYINKIREFKQSGAQATNEISYMRDENTKTKQIVQDLRAKLNELQSRYSQLENEMSDFKSMTEDERRRLNEDHDRMNRELDASEMKAQRLLNELKNVTDMKLNLETEISAYRKLLEAEERPERPHSGTSMGSRNPQRSFQQQPTRGDSTDDRGSVKSIPPARTELTAKTQFDKSFKGTVAIEECSSDGRFVQIHNTGIKVESLSNWRIVRHIDNGRQVVRFAFGEVFLDPNQSIKIWARGQRSRDANPKDLDSPYNSWGTGQHIHTVLYNADGDERAVHIQKTAYENNTN